MDKKAKAGPKIAEIAGEIVTLLEPLSSQDRLKVINGALILLGEAAASESGTQSERPTTPSNQGAQGRDGSHTTAKTFLSEKKPETDVERIACLAYYLTHFSDISQFKTKQLEDLNTEAAQPRISNPGRAVSNATYQNKFLTTTQKGNKQITVIGEEFVDALPDRERANAALKAHRKRKGKKGRKSTVKSRKGSPARS